MINDVCWQKKAVVALLCINLVLLVWYIFYGNQSGFHSDSASLYLLAREVLNTGHYFVPGWNYVNGDIATIYNNTFLIPTLLVSDGYLAVALSRITPTCLVLFGTYWVTTLLTTNRIISLLVVSIVASGISVWMAENLYGQMSYGTYWYISCFILCFTWRCYDKKYSFVNGWMMALAVILVLAFWSNPSRALMIYFLPMLAALLFVQQAHLKDQKEKKWAGCIPLLSVLVMASAVGSLLYFITLTSLNPYVGYTKLHWLSFPQMLENVVHIVHSLFWIFGAIPEVGASVTSISGIYAAARLGMGIVLVIMIPYAAYKCLLSPKMSVRYITAYAVSSFFIALFFQLTTTLFAVHDPLSSSRYLVPSVLLLLVVFVCTQMSSFSSDISSKKYARAFLGAFAIIILASSGYQAFVKDRLVFESNYLLPQAKKNMAEGLADFLISHDLHYGYATFWNAGVTTVLGKERVKIRQVLFNSNMLPEPFRWLGSDNWYEPEAWVGKTFLMVAASEESLLDLNKLEKFLGEKPSEVLSYGDKKIYVFDHNLASKMPGWRMKFDTEYTIAFDENSPRTIGALHENPKTHRYELISKKGEIGFLHFGPYLRVAPGIYDVSFDLSLENKTPNSVRLDVTYRDGKKILGQLILPNASANTSIRIELKRVRTLEFRVFSEGVSGVVLRGISLKRMDH